MQLFGLDRLWDYEVHPCIHGADDVVQFGVAGYAHNKRLLDLVRLAEVADFLCCCEAILLWHLLVHEN